MPEKQKLIELAKAVAKCRMSVEWEGGKRDIAKENMLKTNEGVKFQATCTRLEVLQMDTVATESELRTAVLVDFEETEETEPIEKVKVKIFKHLEYDDAEVLIWCRANAPALLKVDTKTFEKTAVKMKAPVTEKNDPKCTIAKDLSMYLIEQETEDARKEIPPKV